MYFNDTSQNEEQYIDRHPAEPGEITTDKLTLNPEFRHPNIVNFYKEQLNRSEEQTLQIADIEEHNDNITTLNVHSFHPINLEHDKKEVMEAPLKFMRRFNISLLVLQEVPLSALDQFANLVERSGLFHSINEFDDAFATSKEPITNMVISKYPIVLERKLLLPTENYVFRHRHAIFFRIPAHPIWPKKLFCATHLEVAEMHPKDAVRIRKLQLRAIIDQNPDFIIGDLNFAEQTPEYKMIAKFFKTSKASKYTTTPWRTTVDYIWYKKSDPDAKWHIETYSVNYIWSDHRPVIGVFFDKIYSSS